VSNIVLEQVTRVVSASVAWHNESSVWSSCGDVVGDVQVRTLVTIYLRTNGESSSSINEIEGSKNALANVDKNVVVNGDVLNGDNVESNLHEVVNYTVLYLHVRRCLHEHPLTFSIVD